MEVADDGRGGASLDGGSGVQGLLDRVGALGGTLTVESPPGDGTRVIAEIPLTERAAADASRALSASRGASCPPRRRSRIQAERRRRLSFRLGSLGDRGGGAR